MKPFARLAWRAAATLVALVLLAACETTGNPREGGLFGWSESKARERQAQKQSHVAGAESELRHETARGDALQTREDTAAKNLAAATAQRKRTEERLREQTSRLVAKTDKLEAESTTDAMASRARSYRLKVTTIAAQTALTPQQRAERLHILEAEIDAASGKVTRLKAEPSGAR